MSDLISRRAVINEIERWIGYIDGDMIARINIGINKLPSADRPTDGDLISRADAIEALGEEPPVWYDGEDEIAERSQWRADVEAIMSVPSADRPMVIKCESFLSEEDFKTFAEQVRDQNVILIPHEAEVVSTNTSTNTSTKSTNISTDTSADRPRGEWKVRHPKPFFLCECSVCGESEDWMSKFCPNCGADMRTTKGEA